MCFILFLVKLTFAVAQFDRYYTSDSEENNPDESKVKQLVSEAFNDVQEDDVFPVCGRWVLNAYLLKNRPTDLDSQYVVENAYKCYTRKTQGLYIASEQNSMMIDTVLKVGGLKELEIRYSMINCMTSYSINISTRICKSVGNTDLNDWNKVIFSQAEKLLQKPIGAAEDLLKEMRRDCEGIL